MCSGVYKGSSLLWYLDGFVAGPNIHAHFWSERNQAEISTDLEEVATMTVYLHTAEPGHGGKVLKLDEVKTQ